MKQTDIQQFVEDLDGGQFSADLGKILTAVGIAVCDHSAGGEVTIKLKMKQIGKVSIPPDAFIQVLKTNN